MANKLTKEQEEEVWERLKRTTPKFNWVHNNDIATLYPYNQIDPNWDSNNDKNKEDMWKKLSTPYYKSLWGFKPGELVIYAATRGAGKSKIMEKYNEMVQSTKRT